MQCMPIALHQLPDDIDALKSLVADQLVRNEQLQADKQAAEQKNEQLTTENQRYKVQVLRGELPDDIDALKSLVADQLVRNEQLKADKQATREKGG